MNPAMQEITGNVSDNRENSAKDPIMRVEALKAEKRKLKAAITRQLNELVGSRMDCWCKRGH